MKALKSILLLLLVASFGVASATVHRVNNNTSIDADFTSISAAISSASAGDTLYIGGSSQSYGSFNLIKELTIIGPGYYLSDNDTTQAYPQPANFTGITFSAGSEGSVISGIEVRTGVIAVNTNDIVIQRCYIYHTSTTYNINVNSNVSNVLITGNFIHNYYSSSSTSARCISLAGNNSNILITNNIILRAYGITNPNWGYALFIPTNSSAVIQNNTIVGGWYAANSVISGNLQYGGTFSDAGGNTISNNAANSTQFGTSNGNRANIDVLAGVAGTGSYDKDAYWYTNPDTIVITAGNPVPLTGGPSGCTGCSSGTYNSTFNLPPNIVSATVDLRWEGSFSYNYWRIDGVQTQYLSGINSPCGSSGNGAQNVNVTAQVAGKSSVTLQMDFGWYNSCSAQNNPHFAYWDFEFILSTDYTIPPMGAGAFEGNNRYKLSGMPAIPAIFRASVPSSGVTSEPFIFDFSSKSHK